MKLIKLYSNNPRRDCGRYLKIKGNLQLLIVEHIPITALHVIRDVSGNCLEYYPSMPHEII